MTIYVNVNKNTIAANNKHGTNQPPLSARRTRSGPAAYGNRIELSGPAVMVYDPENPLKCGAKVWLETEDTVCVIWEDVDGSTYAVEISP